MKVARVETKLEAQKLDLLKYLVGELVKNFRISRKPVQFL